MENLTLFEEWVLVFAVAYGIGSIPFGFLIGKLNGIDIRQAGSKNIGATNVTRLLGKKWGWPCFLLDFIKGIFPVIFATFAHHQTELLPVSAAIGVVLGHMFPVFLHFRGGKGVSTTLGALAALSPIAVGAGILSWLILFFSTKYVSLASIITLILLPVYLFLTHWLMPEKNIDEAFYWQLGLFILIAVAGTIKHRSNIQRLINGTEYKFNRPKPEETK